MNYLIHLHCLTQLNNIVCEGGLPECNRAGAPDSELTGRAESGRLVSDAVNEGPGCQKSCRRKRLGEYFL